MKLHRNRKRNKFNKLISLALVCCMTLSMGSSYVNAGEVNPAWENSETLQESQTAESVTPQAEGADNQSTDQNADNIEETTSNMEQNFVPVTDSGQQEDHPADMQPDADSDVAGQPADNENQDAGDADLVDEVTADGIKGESGPIENETGNSVRGEISANDNIIAGDEKIADEDQPIPSDESLSDGDQQAVQPDTEATESYIAGDADSVENLARMSGDGAYCFTFFAADNVSTAQNNVPAIQNNVDASNWNFNAYYVNENDKYNVTKEMNYNLKYQMEFRTDVNLDPYAVMIRIERRTFRNRYGADVTPDEIGIPMGELNNITENARTPFNYYIERETAQQQKLDENGKPVKDENGNDVMEDFQKEYLVFFNYRRISAGTSAAWQVLYKNQKLMDIVDNTEWTLTPQISVVNGTKNGETVTPPPEYGRREFITQTQMKGKIDSSVSLTSVSKIPYSRQGINYTPGLYTVSQLGGILGLTSENVLATVDSKYINQNNKTRLNTTDWRFVVWEVKIKGNATQPWNLIVEDTPIVGRFGGRQGIVPVSDAEGNPISGNVLGWKDNADAAAGYGLSIGIPDADGVALSNQKGESWGTRFYVVTAYPAVEGLNANEMFALNDFKVTLEPFDEFDDDVVRESGQSIWNYEEYDWSYSGNILSVQKTTDKTVYTGWLDVYKNASLLGEDYGHLPFTTTSSMNGYSYTHETYGDQVGEYKNGSYYTLTTLDDFIQASWIDENKSEQKVFLGKDDYYFDSVTITQTDIGYDVWEDGTAKTSDLANIAFDRLPARNGSSGGGFSLNNEGKAQSEVRIWAKLANPDPAKSRETKQDSSPESTDNTPWQLVATEYVDASGHMEPYIFGEELIKEKPYRIMVEHDSIDYRSECEINTTVRMNYNSPVMRRIIEARGNAGRDTASTLVQFEGLAGAMGVAYNSSGDKNYCDFENGNVADKNVGYVGLEDLKEISRKIYGVVPARKSVTRDLKWLTETAASYKTAKSTNDVNNNRVLVDYCLTAYDGYEIYDRASLNYLSEQDKTFITPGRSNVVFYDLLPKGVSFDASYPVTAGRITDLDNNLNYTKQPNNWSQTQVEVTVDPNEIRPNYRGTGRTLVVFRIAYSGADSTSYTNRKWIEGWGVSFRAYYDWKDVDTIKGKDINANLSAFMPDFSKEEYTFNHEHRALHGLTTEVYYDDGVLTDPTMAKVYADLVKDGGNIDNYSQYDPIRTGDGSVEKEGFRHVLYANNVINDDVATSFTGGITTLTRAEADRFATFTESTMVSVGTGEDTDGCYAYDITINAGANESNIVVFDRLENAYREHVAADNEPFDFEKQPATWRGDFQSVDINGLKKLGINPVIYYSDCFDETEDNCTAVLPADDQAPTEILNMNQGWYTEAQFQEKYSDNWQSKVKAVALDLSKDENGKNFTLQKDHSLSFQIHMKTDEATREVQYTYNKASYSRVSDSEGEAGGRKLLTSSSAKVGKSLMEKLEIVKQFGGEVPDSLRDKSFEFYLYEIVERQIYDGETDEEKEEKDEGKEEEEKKNIETRKQPLAFAEYQLYKLDTSGEWKLQGSQIRSTDGNGILKLRAGEKAVFITADAERIQVEERADIFWEAKDDTKRSREEDGKRVEDPDGNIITITMTNTYRPVLYVEKELAGVPSGLARTEAALEGVNYVQVPGTDVKYVEFTEAIKDKYEFEFKILKKVGDNAYVPLAEAEYWYVDSVRLDGGTPVRVDASGNVPEDGKSFGTAKTDKDGKFTIRRGQIIALFPGYVDTGYRLVETKNCSPDWTIEESNRIVDGKLTLRGDSQTFTNYYKWKNLYLAKKIEGQEQTDYDNMPQKSFTFQVKMVEETGQEGTTPQAKTVGEFLGEIKDAVNQAAEKVGTGTDEEETEIPTVPVTGLKWQLLDANEKPVLNESKNPVEGTLDSDGKFTCELGFCKVRIIGLEEGRTYIVSEVKDGIPEEGGRDLYRPVGDTVEAAIPTISGRRDIELVNQYLKRSLSVTKTLMESLEEKTEENDGTQSGSGENTGSTADLEFEFYITVNGNAVPVNTEYIVEEKGANPVPRTVETEGVIKLKGGQTAIFKDAGFVGDSFKVWEKEVTDETDSRYKYQQVVPSGENDDKDRQGYGVPAIDTFTEDKLTAEAFFVNGVKGNLLISKEYVADPGNVVLEGVIQKWKEFVRDAEIDSSKDATDNWLTGTTQSSPVPFARFTLEVTDGSDKYVWPKVERGEEPNGKKGVWVQCFKQIDPDKSYRIFWPVGETINVYPWVTIIIPEDQFPEGATYTLRESDESQHWINTEIVKVGTGGYGAEVPMYIEADQSYPESDQPLTGTIEEKPMATIQNKISMLITGGDLIQKQMLIDSAPVSLDAKLVFRLEKYVREEEKWIPAAGVEYVRTGTAAGIDRLVIGTQYNKQINKAVIDILSSQKETTGEDGKIVVTRYRKETGDPRRPYIDLYPGVWFIKDTVYTNLYSSQDISNKLIGLPPGEALYRLVEIPEESSAEWGYLAGYTRMNATQGNIATQSIELLYNSNQVEEVEIAKDMADGYNDPDEPFTMILKQIVGVKIDEGLRNFLIQQGMEGNNPDAIQTPMWLVGKYIQNSDDYAKYITAVEPRSGISYTVHDEKGKVVGNGVTGVNGEIQLLAGQYVTMGLPQGTLWTVSEKQDATPNYKLVDLNPKGKSENLTWLNSNLMMINMVLPEVSFVQYTVNKYDIDTGLLEGTDYGTGVAGEHKRLTDEDTVDFEGNSKPGYRGRKYTFVKDAPGNVLDLKLDTAEENNVFGLYFRKVCTLTYDRGYEFDDDGDGQIDDSIIGSDTNDASGMVTIGPAPTREGFTFLGWKIGDDEKLYQPGEKYRLRQYETAVAQWAEFYIEVEFKGITKIPDDFIIMGLGGDVPSAWLQLKNMKPEIVENSENGIILRWTLPTPEDIVWEKNFRIMEQNYRINGYDVEVISEKAIESKIGVSYALITYKIDDSILGQSLKIINTYTPVTQ